MDNFRYLSLLKFIKMAGPVSDTVQQYLNQSPSEPLDKKPINFQNLGNVGPGTTVLIPNEPVNNDGSVNMIFNFRGLTGDAKTVGGLGINAVVITAEAVGPKDQNLGSKLLDQQFGNATFINNAIGKVISNLKQKYPDKNVHLGKLVLSGFSGGGSPIGSLLTQRNQLPKINAVVIADGTHYDNNSNKMNSLLDYAKEAKENPNQQKLVLLTTPIDPKKYRPTRSVSNEVAKTLNLQKLPPPPSNNLNYNHNLYQQAISENGGVQLYDLFDKEMPWLNRDENGVMKPYVKGKSNAWQHMNALDTMKQNYANYLRGII